MTKRSALIYIMSVMTVVALIGMTVLSIIIASKYSVYGETCEHEFGEWFVETPPDCGNEGVEKCICKKCGKEVTFPIAPRGEHEYGEWTETEPSICGNPGKETRKCKICGHEEKRGTPPTGEHQYGEWESVIEPTCGVGGMKKRECKECGHVDYQYLPATGNHDFDENGVCRNCGAKENGQVGDGPGDGPGDGGGGIPGGQVGSDLDESGNIHFYPPSDDKEIVALSVYSEVSGAVYFRYMNFGDYTGKKWLQASEYKGLMGDKYSYNYLLSYMLSLYGYSSYDMRIKVSGSQYYLPYYTSLEGGNYEIQTSDVKYKGDTSKEYSLKFYRYNHLQNGLIGSPVSGIYDSNYNSFVHSQYLQVPAYTRSFLDEIIVKQGFDAGDKRIIAKVAQYVQSVATYNVDYNHAMDNEEDIVVAFLDKYKEGVCQHYASAATLLYRALGIPARYVCGYVGNVEAGEYVDITTKQAHAWVEVFVEDYGWIQVEVTGSSGDSSGGDIGGNPGGEVGGNQGGEQGGEQGGQDNEKIGITIQTESIKRVYDGTVLRAEGYEIIGGSLAEGHYIASVIFGGIKNVGIADNRILDIVICDENGKEVTDSYKITCRYGTLEVERRELVIATKSAEKAYDGTALKCEEYSILSESGVANGDKIILVFGAGQISRGRCDNEAKVIIRDSLGNDVTENYAITTTFGTLTVR